MPSPSAKTPNSKHNGQQHGLDGGGAVASHTGGGSRERRGTGIVWQERDAGAVGAWQEGRHGASRGDARHGYARYCSDVHWSPQNAVHELAYDHGAVMRMRHMPLPYGLSPTPTKVTRPGFVRGRVMGDGETGTPSGQRLEYGVHGSPAQVCVCVCVSVRERERERDVYRAR